MAEARAYYNDTEEYVCNWLANLMLAGLIPEGDIDQRSIRDVTPGDLRGYTQCHFFAGIGGWAYALRFAGWPDDEPVWTGSCPCQPFSVAGKQKGFDDDRHLWPAFYSLIEKRRPIRIFGEQVAKAPEWLDLVRRDVEAVDYALGVVPIEADDDLGPQIALGQRRDAGAQLASSARDDIRHLVNRSQFGWGEGWSEHEFRRRGFTAAVANCDGLQYLECPDGKWRRLPPPRVRWLGNGIPARVSKLRALGNAIDPRPAAEFIKSYMDLRGIT